MATLVRILNLLGPIGWLFFAGAVVLYWRLWRSADVTRVRELQEENVRAQGSITQLRQIERRLKSRNSELVTKVNALVSDNNDLKHAVKLLRQANDLQSATIDRMDKYQREQAGKIEWLVSRVIQIEAANGIVTKLPWNQ
jgi:GTPase involved in cell partitioning and DNA repair